MPNKKILFFAILLIGAVFVFSVVQAAAVAVNDWAWSDNIGWIQMDPSPGGVFIDNSTGAFSGYAWSDNIGWIDFTDTKLDWLNGQVSGWAKAVAGDAASGWDGLISMRGASPDYGVNVNLSTGAFSGYAWGSDVVGWVDFSKATLTAVPTLFVSLAANPSVGTVPLTSDLTAVVSGTALGPITYKFDCTNDGIYEGVFNNITETTKTYSSCAYAAAGSYTAKVYAERDVLNAEATVAIAVGDPGGPPVVSITANPGTVDYNTSSTLSWSVVNADTCTALGDALGDWSGLKNPVSGSQPTGNLISDKTYTLTCTGPKGTGSKSVTVQVNPAPTPTCVLSASPPSGESPLNVTLSASASGGSGSGFQYMFDYTNDGTYDTSYSVSNTSTHIYTANSVANAMIKDSNGTEATCATSISIEIIGSLSVSLLVDPDSNPAPLTTDLTAAVSGTAGGTINYTFWWDCNDSGTSVNEVESVCGKPYNPDTGIGDSDIGIKYDNIPDTSITERHTYSSPGLYFAKVIAERGSAPASQTGASINVGPPVPYFRLNDLTPLHATIIEGLSTDSSATTITVTPINDFDSDVLLSAQWKDFGTDADFIFSDDRLSFSEYNTGTGSTFKVNVKGTAKPGLYTITIKGIADDADGFVSTEDVKLNIDSVSVSEIWEF